MSFLNEGHNQWLPVQHPSMSVVGSASEKLRGRASGQTFWPGHITSIACSSLQRVSSGGTLSPATACRRSRYTNVLSMSRYLKSWYLGTEIEMIKDKLYNYSSIEKLCTIIFLHFKMTSHNLHALKWALAIEVPLSFGFLSHLRQSEYVKINGKWQEAKRNCVKPVFLLILFYSHVFILNSTYVFYTYLFY